MAQLIEECKLWFTKACVYATCAHIAKNLQDAAAEKNFAWWAAYCTAEGIRYLAMAMNNLDKMVAVEVMGEREPQCWADSSVGPSHGDPGGYQTGTKPYSTDIRFAMEVVEKMAKAGYEFDCSHTGAGGMFAPARFGLTRNFEGISWQSEEWGEGEGWKRSYAEALATAICKAALDAVERAKTYSEIFVAKK